MRRKDREIDDFEEIIENGSEGVLIHICGGSLS